MIKSKRNFLAALFGTAALVPTLRSPLPANLYDHLKCCWSWYESKDILNARPTRNNSTAARSEASFTVLSDSSGRDLLRLNPMALQVWELCDGRTSVDDMVVTIVNRYEVMPRACVTDVLLALTTFKRNGLILC